MCVMCVAIPFVLVTIAPRFITAAEVNLFFLLETILGPIWVWFIIKEQPKQEVKEKLLQGNLTKDLPQEENPTKKPYTSPWGNPGGKIG